MKAVLSIALFAAIFAVSGVSLAASNNGGAGGGQNTQRISSPVTVPTEDGGTAVIIPGIYTCVDYVNASDQSEYVQVCTEAED